MATPKISVVVPIAKWRSAWPGAWTPCLRRTCPIGKACWSTMARRTARAILRLPIAKRTRFTLVDKENGGLSSARNAGIAASGAYRCVFGFRRPIYARCMPRDRRCL